MNYSQRYAKNICEKYGVSFHLSQIPNDELSILAIARKVLPTDKLKLWLLDQVAELRTLRQELGLEPYDLHREGINRELANL